MPLFFASSAIYPLAIMPSWIKPIAIINPLTYVVDAMRDLLATGNLSSLPLDFLVITAATILFLVLASLGLKKDGIIESGPLFLLIQYCSAKEGF